MDKKSATNPHYTEDLLRQANESRRQIQVKNLENLRKQAKELLSRFHDSDEAAIERFSANHPNYPKDKICLADAQSVIAREKGFASWPKMKSCLEQALLPDEVERIHRKLHVDGKDHFVQVITVESLKRAISKGMQSYQALPESREGGMQYFEDTIKPLLLNIVNWAIWPENGLVDIYYEQTDERGVTYEGLGASLEILTPGASFPGFSLALIDLWYGRF